MNKPYIYQYDRKIKRDGTAPLYLRVFIGSVKVEINTEIAVTPKNWNKETQLITSGENKKDFNLKLKEIVGRASGIIRKYDANNRTLTREVFEKELLNPAVFVDFYAFVEDEIRMRRGEITDTTIDGQLSVLNKMKAYKPTLMLSELDEDYIKGFVKFMKITLKNTNATYSAALNVIRTYSKIAVKKGLIERSPFEYYKIKKEKTYPEFLTEDERDALVQLYNSNRLLDSHKKVLRHFVFVLYTGLRIGDLRSITFGCIVNNRLSFRPIKTQNVTNIRVDIPLTKTALQMISDEGRTQFEEAAVFKCFSEQRMNKYIKEVCAVAGIRKDVSFHTARHTFATLFLRTTKAANGILLLQKILGHSDLKSTIIYSHVITTDVDSAMHEFDS